MDMKTTVGGEKIRSLFDAGTFAELGAYVRASASAASSNGLICGYGSIGGKLVFAFAQDMDAMKGALDEAGAKKLRSLYDLAIKNGAPVVGLFDSTGAVVYDGTSVLDAYGTWMRMVSDASGIVPQIALVSGVCCGSALIAASMFDVMYTVKGESKLYLTAPSIVGAEIGDADNAAALGLAAKNCENEAEAMNAVRALIDLLPQNNCDRPVADPEQPNRALTADAHLPSDMLDSGVFVEWFEELAPEVRVGLGRMGGETVGIVYANGVLTSEAARKAARMVSLCDAFRLPVITLVDSDGNHELQSAANAKAYACLATTYASALCPKISVILGHAYGNAYTLLGSRALGADMVFALPEAQIGTMTPGRAVAFVWNDRVTDETPREALEKEWIDTYASAKVAAAKGDIDDIIQAEELRMRLCSAVYMLAAKADGKPARRHPTLGL